MPSQKIICSLFIHGTIRQSDISVFIIFEPRSGEKMFHHVPTHVPQSHVTSGRNFVEMSNISEAQTNKIVHNSSQDNSLHDFYPVLVNHRPRARTLERGIKLYFEEN